MITDRFTARAQTEGDSTARLVLRGDIDVAADEALGAAAREATARGAARLVLDFHDVGYINSTGIALIVRLLAEARRDHREVIAEGLSPHYREIFRITRLSDFLTIADPPASSEETDGHD
jgi:anti-anti-sigma factor